MSTTSLQAAAQPEHLYQTVENDLLKRIVSGELAAGSQLPTESELCEQYDVSRITVRRAIQDLADKGLVFRLRGRGTSVSSSIISPKHSTNVIFNLASELQYGSTTEKRILESRLVPANRAVSSHLGCDEDAPVQYVKRLVTIDGNPCAIDEVYASTQTLPNLLALLVDGSSLFALIEHHYKITTGVEDLRLTAGLAGKDEAKILSYVVGAPVLLLEHITHDLTGTSLHYSKTLWRADAASFEFRISGDGRLI